MQRTENGYDALVEYRIRPKTFLGVTAQRVSTDYGDNPVINGVNYAHEFNRATTGGGATLRYQLTPITSVSLVATRTEDRFEFSTLRDSNSTVASAVIAFDPLGILSGTATIGYTVFSTLTADVPRFEGPTGAINVSYRLLGNMRIGVTAVRSVEYSYDINEPYYLQTGFGGSLTRSVVGPLDVMVRGGVYNLAYRDREGVVIAVPNREDSVYSYGLGAGYHLGKGVRLGFNIDEARRDSAIPECTVRRIAVWIIGDVCLLEFGQSRSLPLLCLSANVGAQAPSPGITDYVVGPQDVLTITSYDQADLSGKFTLEADGTFTYPLIGRVKAGGLHAARAGRFAEEAAEGRRVLQESPDHRVGRDLQEPEGVCRRRGANARHLSAVR